MRFFSLSAFYTVFIFIQLLTQGQVMSGQSAHSGQALVSHACHGHKYQPSPVPLSGTGFNLKLCLPFI